jgi:hypothetical protein
MYATFTYNNLSIYSYLDYINICLDIYQTNLHTWNIGPPCEERLHLPKGSKNDLDYVRDRFFPNAFQFVYHPAL